MNGVTPRSYDAEALALAQAKLMLKLGIIDLIDYDTIDHALLEKYKLPLSSLYRNISLINSWNRGNISH